MKFIPVTVRVKADPPAMASAGASEVMAGALTVNVLVPDDAAGEFWTVMLWGPAAASWAPVTAAVSDVALA